MAESRPTLPLAHVDLTLVWSHGKGLPGVTEIGIGGSWVSLRGWGLRKPLPPPSQRVIRSRSQSMDAMGLSNKKPNTVSTSHSGSFAPNNPDLAKAAGIVSALPQGPRLPPLPCCPRAHPGP